MTDQHEEPDRPRLAEGRSAPALVAIAAVAVAIVVAIVVVVVVGDDDPPTLDSPTTELVSRPTTVLDELFPDRATPPEGAPTPTPDPSGAAGAATDVVMVDALWTENSFGEVDVVVLVENTGSEAYANVSAIAVVVDDAGAELTRIPGAYARVDPGQVVPISTSLAIDVASIAAIELEAGARGTLPPGDGPATISGLAWEQDDVGTVEVSGVLTPASRADFVAIVAVLRSADDTFLGSAFGFVDAVGADGVEIVATGFPAGDVASIEVYSTG